ncbi:MAG: alcohol dehydrogenase [Crocinitomicaceae bacterium]|nr:alcohol dehydrogenase [Crocinitomicaceae bacterium]|tara:strand:- start:38817 stop:39836 length:1020 start_codon:yes stop_codon:yes gene_type:complete
MKAVYLTSFGKPGSQAFEIREAEEPSIEPNEVKINAQAFGLNYADVMARKGIYNDCPELPAILGYECVGTVEEIGAEVTNVKTGDRVIAFTRFGSYAKKVVTHSMAVQKIDNDIPNGEAVALATQYCTAWFASNEAINMYKGEHVLIHAAAGGVGTALVQLAKEKDCIVYGTASSSRKLDYLKSIGVDYPINYKEQDFEEEIRKLRGKKKVDVIFDPIGGKNFNKSLKILAYGGRMVPYGASSRERKGILSLLKVAWGFGLHLPVGNIMKSQIWAGVNMLRIADYKPELIQRCLEGVYDFYTKGIAKPHVGGVYPVSQIGDAHDFLESRKSIGKIVVEW